MGMENEIKRLEQEKGNLYKRISKMNAETEKIAISLFGSAKPTNLRTDVIIDGIERMRRTADESNKRIKQSGDLRAIADLKSQTENAHEAFWMAKEAWDKIEVALNVILAEAPKESQ